MYAGAYGMGLPYLIVGSTVTVCVDTRYLPYRHRTGIYCSSRFSAVLRIRITLMRIRDRPAYDFVADPDPACHFDADPDPDPPFTFF